MNDRQIKAFLEAARLLNFTKAAEKLYVPQSQVSRAIAALEKELGTVLFERENSRSITLSGRNTSACSADLRRNSAGQGSRCAKKLMS